MNELEYIRSNVDAFLENLENHGIIIGWKKFKEEQEHRKNEVKDDNTSE